MSKMTSTKQADALIKLHIAEYTALTTRGSYWIVLQYGLAAVVPPYLTLMISVWQTNVFNKWASYAGLQIIGILWTQTMLEEFSIVKYLECYLRPQIRTLISEEMFFGWEPYLVKNRPIQIGWGGFFVPILSLLFLTVILIIRSQEGFVWGDFIGVLINLFLSSMLWFNSYKSNKLLYEWCEYDRVLAQRLGNLNSGIGEAETNADSH